jgi:hypothetical protein
VRRFKHDHTRNIWTPLFLIWPIIVFIFAALAPVILLIVVLTRPARDWPGILMAVPRLFVVFCAMRGLSIDVDERDKKFKLELR